MVIINYQKAITYIQIVLEDKLHKSVLYLVEWYQGGVIQLEEVYKNTIYPVIEVLHGNQAVYWTPNNLVLEDYDKSTLIISQ